MFFSQSCVSVDFFVINMCPDLGEDPQSFLTLCMTDKVLYCVNLLNKI